VAVTLASIHPPPCLVGYLQGFVVERDIFYYYLIDYFCFRFRAREIYVRGLARYYIPIPQGWGVTQFLIYGL
jgi:hypothetical protein